MPPALELFLLDLRVAFWHCQPAVGHQAGKQYFRKFFSRVTTSRA
jgi:hypothetical protein